MHTVQLGGELTLLFTYLLHYYYHIKHHTTADPDSVTSILIQTERIERESVLLRVTGKGVLLLNVE